MESHEYFPDGEVNAPMNWSVVELPTAYRRQDGLQQCYECGAWAVDVRKHTTLCHACGADYSYTEG